MDSREPAPRRLLFALLALPFLLMFAGMWAWNLLLRWMNMMHDESGF
jgi:hypothetical protein